MEIYTAKQKISLIIDLNFTLSEEKNLEIQMPDKALTRSFM